ncbi:hypothetical protein J6590_026342 [Homalodisca vitripennis]|nr:hypothetical protein J6590_026342 [Homalodisca vitripennis]
MSFIDKGLHSQSSHGTARGWKLISADVLRRDLLIKVLETPRDERCQSPGSASCQDSPVTSSP